MIEFPLYIPEKRDSDRMIFLRFIKNQSNNKNYILSLNVKPTEETLSVMGLDNFRVFENALELKEFFNKIAEAESSIEGISLFENECHSFISLR